MSISSKIFHVVHSRINPLLYLVHYGGKRIIARKHPIPFHSTLNTGTCFRPPLYTQTSGVVSNMPNVARNISSYKHKQSQARYFTVFPFNLQSRRIFRILSSCS